MSDPSQKYLRDLRENPSRDLVEYVNRLAPGVHGITELWKGFNNGCGFHGKFRVFRYALLHAGMTEETFGGRLVKP